MGYYTLPAQRELFPREGSKTSLPPAVIERLVLLVGQLLTEAAAVKLATIEQVDEHQDHA